MKAFLTDLARGFLAAAFAAFAFFASKVAPAATFFVNVAWVSFALLTFIVLTGFSAALYHFAGKLADRAGE